MHISEMNLEDIETRKEEISEEMDKADADIDALTEEVRALNEREKELRKKQELRQAVAGGKGKEIRSFPSITESKSVDYASEEYRSSKEYKRIWLRHLQRKTLTAEEQRAFDTAGGAMATMTANSIMEVVKEHAPLLDRMTVIRSAAKITIYVEGTVTDAKDHVQNAVIEADPDTLILITLDPAEITKLVQVSAAAERMSVDAFEAYLITAVETAATSKGISISAATVQALMGAVKGEVNLICNNTLYTKLLPLQDNSKNALVKFEGGKATVYGREVLLDDSVADDTVLAGDLTKAGAALADDVNVVKQFDIDTNSYKYLGVAIFDVKVGVNDAFAKLTTA